MISRLFIRLALIPMLGLTLGLGPVSAPSSVGQTQEVPLAIGTPDPTIYLPLVLKNYFAGTGIYGLVTLNGTPAAGVSLDLRFYNGLTLSTAATTTTDANGRYSFTSAASLSAGQTYYVRFLNPATTADGRLGIWLTGDLTSYSAGSSVDIGDFDLADIALSPTPGAPVSLPATFQWTRRSATSSDSYQFELFDPNGPSDYLSPLLGYAGDYTLNSLPGGFGTGTPYGWDVLVHSPDGGFGGSFYYNGVTF
jgi:hypothetical protein